MGVCDNFPEGDVFFDLLTKEAKENAIPIAGTFELTPRCNFNCKMCYVHLDKDTIPKYGRELTAEEWIDTARQAKDAGMLQLCITGGEPLLHPHFFEIYRAVAEMGFFITLQTNASMITEKVLSLLREYPPKLVKITVYGSDDNVYKEVCGVEQGFRRVDAGIRALQGLNIPMVLVTTVIKQNKDDLVNIAKYCNKLAIPWTYTATVHPSIRGAQTDVAGVAIDENTATDFRADVRRMIAEPVMKDDKKPCEYCKGYRSSFWITWDGKIRFCSFMNEPDISINESGFEKAWKQLVEYEEELRWPEECECCEIRHVCRRCMGTLASRSGSVKKVDRAFCERLKKYTKEEGY